jgi:hypothetical protein
VCKSNVANSIGTVQESFTEYKSVIINPTMNGMDIASPPDSAYKLRLVQELLEIRN